jgi:hypothetical protein
MPSGLNSNAETTYISPGFKNMPCSLESLSGEEEADIVLTLIRELNQKFVVDLDNKIEVQDRALLEDEDEKEDAHTPKRFLVIGNSHGSMGMKRASYKLQTGRRTWRRTPT